MLKKVKIKVSGKVQGVFFRQNSEKKAKGLELLGYAKNEEDGSVVIELEGEENNILEYLKWVRRGPELAEIKDIEINYEDKPLEFTDFKVY